MRSKEEKPVVKKQEAKKEAPKEQAAAGKKKKKPGKRKAKNPEAEIVATEEAQSIELQPQELQQIETQAPAMEPTPVVVATPQKAVPKKEKLSLKEKASTFKQKVAAVLSPEKREAAVLQAGRSYAALAAAPARAAEVQPITFEDNNDVEIVVPVGWSGNQVNPLVGIPYSDHVKEKMQLQQDFFHSFSPHIEEQLGKFVHAETIKKATKQHSATTQYTIRGTMGVFGGKKEFPGQFEFLVRDGIMTHRFFRRDKHVDKKNKFDKKEKAPLLLPQAPEKYQER